MKKSGLLILFFILSNTGSFAQCETAAEHCEKLLTGAFVSDGVKYKALLVSPESAEFHTTFLSETTYRLVTGTGKEKVKVSFKVYDGERNLIFDSKDFGDPAVWDFTFKTTLHGIIEASLPKGESGCALMLIGFKK